MAKIVLEDVTKVYKGGVKAVDKFSMEIDEGEFIVFVGPSGCGKSTTLRMIAGLEEITEGNLYINGVYSNELEPKDRDLAMVFQNYALYPYLNVYDNIAFGLRLRHFSKEEIDQKVHQVAEIFGLQDLLKRKPKALSGGQRQRVALARAVVREAKAYLLDEPLSNLDAKLRTQMRVEIIKLFERLKTTFIYVTHDQVEAMTMGTRIVVMKDGIIQQIDTPVHLYDHPTNLFVASFIGTPQMNFFKGKIEHLTKKSKITLENGNQIDILKSKLARTDIEDVVLGIRSEDIAISEKGMEARVRMIETLGSETLIYLSFDQDNSIINNNDFIVKVQGRVDYRVNDVVKVNFDENKLHLFDSITEESIIKL